MIRWDDMLTAENARGTRVPPGLSGRVGPLSPCALFRPEGTNLECFHTFTLLRETLPTSSES